MTSCGPVCPSNQNIYGFTFQSNLKYEVHNEINAYNKIFPFAQNVVYDAGDEINLLPNFEARDGCDFIALIEGCGGAYKTVEPQHLFTDEVSKEIKLSNYPNPFSKTTTIEFVLPDSDYVQLSIFNTNGIEIVKLIDNERYEKGKHQVQFDAEKLNWGIYYYTIQTSQEQVSKKLMISK